MTAAPAHLVAPAIIVNPHSRAGRTGAEWDEMKTLLDSIFIKPQYLLTTKPGDAETFAMDAVRDGLDTIYTIGGDGTINEVVNGIMRAESDREITLGTFPAGTGSDTVRVLRHSGSFAEFAEYLPAARAHPVDVGVVELLELTDKRPFVRASEPGRPIRRYFINEACVGLGGIVARMVNASKKSRGIFLKKSIEAILRAKPAAVRVEADGHVLGDFSIFVSWFANCRFSGGGMTVSNGFVDDGKLDMLLVPSMGVLMSVVSSGTLYKGVDAIRAKTNAMVHRARSFTVTPLTTLSSDTPKEAAKRQRWAEAGLSGTYIETDGETPGICPATFSVVQGRLRLLALQKRVRVGKQ